MNKILVGIFDKYKQIYLLKNREQFFKIMKKLKTYLV